MVVKVHLVALGRYGDYRMVEITSEDNVFARDNTAGVLQEVWYWGQNENDRQDKPSVSMGDVAELWGRYWLCCSMGWKELTFNEWLDYLGMSNQDRMMYALDSTKVPVD